MKNIHLRKTNTAVKLYFYLLSIWWINIFITLNVFKRKLLFYKGVYIKYVEGGAGGFHKFFKNYFVAQGIIELNISWPSSFFVKSFMAPPINFSFLFIKLACGSISGKYSRYYYIRTKGGNIHNNIQTVLTAVHKYSLQFSMKYLV